MWRSRESVFRERALKFSSIFRIACAARFVCHFASNFQHFSFDVRSAFPVVAIPSTDPVFRARRAGGRGGGVGHAGFRCCRSCRARRAPSPSFRGFRVAPSISSVDLFLPVRCAVRSGWAWGERAVNVSGAGVTCRFFFRCIWGKSPFPVFHARGLDRWRGRASAVRGSHFVCMLVSRGILANC